MASYDDDETKRAQVKRMQELDQATAFMGDVLPSVWRRMYLNMVKEGFTELQAMDLLKVHIAKPG